MPAKRRTVAWLLTVAAVCMGLVVMAPGTATAAKSNFSGTYSGTFYQRSVGTQCDGFNPGIRTTGEFQATSNWGKGTIYTDQCAIISPSVVMISNTFQFVTPKGTLYAVGDTGPLTPPAPPCDVNDPAENCSAETNRTYTALGGTGIFKKVVAGGLITLSGFAQGVQGSWPFNYTAVENGTLSGNL